jgi:large subunit ribosomal protein L32
MAVPKRRHSSTRGKKRRTNWKLSVSARSLCSPCSQPKLPHRVCGHCGYYAGEEIVTREASKTT